MPGIIQDIQYISLARMTNRMRPEHSHDLGQGHLPHLVDIRPVDESRRCVVDVILNHKETNYIMEVVFIAL